PVLSFMATAKPYYVRNAGGLEERSEPSYVGSRGPMLAGTDGALYSWRNGAFGQFGGLRQLMQMAYATDLAGFQEAMLLHQLPCFQVLYADQVGNLFYLYNARTGNRTTAITAEDRNPINWSKPLDASRERFAWDAIVAPGQLPSIVNPKAGYIQACGTPPWLATTDSDLVAGDWPTWLVPEEESYRVFRVRQILSSGRFTPADMEAMLYDTYLPAAADMVSLLLAMAEARPDLLRAAHPDLVTGLTLLQNWNLTSDRDNEALVYYNRWWALMIARHQADFASEAALYRGLLENSGAAQSYALEAANDAARAMRNDFNRLAIPWGEVHRLRRGGREEAMFGADTGDPIFLAGSPVSLGGRSQTNFGYGFAMVVEFGETPRASSIVPFGASENPGSVHYSDQMDLFLDRRMKPTHFSYDEMTQNAAQGYGHHIVLGTPGLDGSCSFTLQRPGAVSLEAVTYPPRPYPGGQEPFTPTVRPVWEQGNDDLPWELEWYVDESACKTENLMRLRFHTYTPEDGWKPLLRQRLDTDGETFTGSGSGAVMITLMGPSDMLEKPEPVEEPPMPDGDVVDEEEAPSGAFTREQREESEVAEVMPGEGDGEAGQEDQAHEPQMEAPTRRLYDLEIVGAPAEEAPPEPKKKGLRGLLKKFRNSE
ncbi:MAG: penicillin acylase family protein, partial [Candidatus Hydrogenedentes bacterium]|nr:penicillin acylase family protein [Candidatus Hydrogenedentota bacterium]